jgi:hypothetical protein
MVNYGLGVGCGLSLVALFWLVVWMAVTGSAVLGLGVIAVALAANKGWMVLVLAGLLILWILIGAVRAELRQKA